MTSIVQLFPPVREAPMELKSLKRWPPRQTDVFRSALFCHIDYDVHYQ
jgi:hypothetical protein